MNRIVVSRSTRQDFLTRKIREKSARKLQKGLPNLALLLRDNISTAILSGARHDNHVIETIKFLNKKHEHSDYFVDIGANLGLVAVEVGNDFKHVFCFEPSTQISPLLRLNLEINLETPFQLREYGLDKKSQTDLLYIPKNNLGGAFVRSEAQSLNVNQLLHKDNIGLLHSENYFVKEIELRSTVDEIRKIFDSLDLQPKGIVKVDIEGMDISVVSDLARFMSERCTAFIIFENHSTEGTFEEHFGTECEGANSLFQIERSPYRNSDSKLIKFIKSIHRPYQVSLRRVNQLEKMRKGDFLLCIGQDLK